MKKCFRRQSHKVTKKIHSFVTLVCSMALGYSAKSPKSQECIEVKNNYYYKVCVLYWFTSGPQKSCDFVTFCTGSGFIGFLVVTSM